MPSAETLAYCFIRHKEQVVPIEKAPQGKLMQYNPDFDTYNYMNFNCLTFLSPQIRQEQREVLDKYTMSNLETMLGERFHVLLSQRTYTIRDGQLFTQDANEPLLDIFIRGKEYRKQNGSIPSDQEREEAEVESFKQIQDDIIDPNNPKKKIYLWISQPGKEGTEYRHNFYDAYTDEGNRVDYRRYSSALGKKETFAKVFEIDPEYAKSEREADPDFIPDDVYYLQHPIQIDPKASSLANADDIHSFFHTEHGYMDKEVFKQVIAALQGYFDAYIQAVANDPSDIRMRNISYNALLNKADALAEKIQKLKEAGMSIVHTQEYARSAFAPSREEIILLGSRPVREVMTGCGVSGGMSIAEILNPSFLRDVTRSAFSVVDFALMQLSGELGYSFDKEGNCVVCGKEGAKIGPCGICEFCDRAIRRQQGIKLPLDPAA